MRKKRKKVPSRRVRRVGTLEFNVDIAPRRRSRRFREGRKPLRIPPVAVRLLCAAVSLAFLLFAWAAMRRHLLQSRFGDIEKVYMENNHHYGEREIRRIAGLPPDGRPFSVDLASCRRRLEGHPDIRRASLKRLVPDALSIRIEEREPVAFLRQYRWSRTAVVDEEGVVLTARKVPAAGRLPVVRGYAGARLTPGDRVRSPEVGNALRVIRYLRRSPLGVTLRVGHIDVSDPGNTVLHAPGVAEEVRLGCVNLEDRLKTLSRVLQNRHPSSSARGAEYIDLRWEDPVEKPKGG